MKTAMGSGAIENAARRVYSVIMPATWVCAECHEPAVRVGDVIRCTSPDCGVARILPDVSEVPWRYEGEDFS